MNLLNSYCLLDMFSLYIAVDWKDYPNYLATKQIQELFLHIGVAYFS